MRKVHLLYKGLDNYFTFCCIGFILMIKGLCVNKINLLLSCVNLTKVFIRSVKAKINCSSNFHIFKAASSIKTIITVHLVF